MKFLLALLFISPLLAETPITSFACGSCYKVSQDKAHIFQTIAKDKPQVFLFMGDNIYADTYDAKVMKEKYDRLINSPDYAAFSKQTPIIPVWDDHDYGVNDAGREYPMKEKSAELFFEAFKFPVDHEARKTPGIYHSRIMGPEGQRTQFIMLDTRSFRSKLVKQKVKSRQTYIPQTDKAATILGETQWAWFKKELEKKAELRVIVSSIQVIASEHRFEKWENMPNERIRFINLLKSASSGPTILLSGDRHLAEVNVLKKENTPLDFDLCEMTSSGMTHGNAFKDPLTTRVADTYSRAKNYGVVDIDWSGEKPSVKLKIKGVTGEVLSTTKITF